MTADYVDWPMLKVMVTLGCLAAASPTLAQNCSLGWSIVAGGISGGSGNRGVFALTPFDDGSGPALYAIGKFTSAGSVLADGVARWDGQRWIAPIGGGATLGIDGPISALTFDDGGGPALYFASSGVVRLSGATLVPLGSNYPQGPALTVFDDGSGPALYAGGTVTAPLNGVGKWTGSTWVSVGGGVNGPSTQSPRVTCLFGTPGGGTVPPGLYAGGRFTSAGGQPASGIARWNGSSWSPLGAGLTVAGGGLPQVYSMALYDDGSGPALYVSGLFITAGGQPASCLARWNGSAWSTNFGSVFDFEQAYAMQVFDDGQGPRPALFLAGIPGNSGVLRSGFARYDGVSWTVPGGGVNDRAYSLAVYDAGSGPGLYIGGRFSQTGTGLPASYIARWGLPQCRANCDGSRSAGCPTLNVNDFICFMNRFAAADQRANCDASSTPPTLNVNDFICFQNAFAAGCP